MRWVTRRHIRVNRAATAWLIRRFIDPDATFAFVEPERDDHETVERAAFLYDALYAWLQDQQRSPR